MTDLQPALNVDVVHCERRARALAADASNGVSLVEGELITPAFFDAVAAETDEELREAGVIGVGELARRHGLSADLMTKALRERVEKAERTSEAMAVSAARAVAAKRAEALGKAPFVMPEGWEPPTEKRT